MSAKEIITNNTMNSKGFSFHHQFFCSSYVISVFLLYFFNISFTVYAQEIVFRSTLNKNKVSINETFQLTFTLENADGNNFKAPSLSDFYIVGGPNFGNSMRFINGSMSRSSSYSYYLQPKKEGNFNIAQATIEVNGRILKSNSVVVEVFKGNALGGNNQGNNSSQVPSIEQQLNDNVFVKAIADKDEVYLGEQVTITYKFYTRMDISKSLSFPKMPAFNGFWTQDLENIQNLVFTNEVYKGVQFKVATLKKVAVFPQRAGDLEIDPLGVETAVRVQTKSRSRNIWDDFFGTYQDVPFTMQSNKVKIKVKPLPTANKPADFSGIVGSFKMDVKTDKNTTNVDDPITLSIKIQGDGNVKMIEKPMLDLPKDFDVFDPKINESVTKRNNTVTGYKTYDYLLVPRRPGTFKIPTFQFSYFDLSKKNYITLSSPEFNISVTGQASANTSQTVTGIKKEEVELLGNDIRYIKSTASFAEKNNVFFGTALFSASYITPFILFIALFLFKRKEAELKGNTVLMKRKQATKAAAKRLAIAKKYLENNEQKLFYNETSKAIYGYMADKLNIQQGELNKENITIQLQQKNINEATIKNIFTVIDDCEMALFASFSGSDMKKIYTQTESIINELEAALK